MRLRPPLPFRRITLGVGLFISGLKLSFGSPRRVMWLLRKGGAAFKRGGVHEVKARMFAYASRYAQTRAYDEWVRLYDALTNEDRKAIRRRLDTLSYKPLISIIMPVYNTPETWLRSAIDSVVGQLYAQWELCIADDASRLPHVREILNERREGDPRIKVVFRERNGHIAAASNSALELATGEYVALLDHDDELAEHALYMVAEELNRYPDADLIYSDEDKIEERGRRYDPYFKPDWNPDLFCSQNVISHLGVYRTALIRRVGGFREGYEGSQDYDLALRIVERTASSRIRHIPHVLYHWRAILGSAAAASEAKPYAQEAAGRAIQSHFERMGVAVQVAPALGVFHRVKYALPDSPPLVSLIVLTRDRVGLLRKCLEGILEKTDYDRTEVLIVDHESRQRRTLAYLERLASDSRVRVIRYTDPFNFSEMNNRAARIARGEVLGFINNDVEVISQGWLREMVSHAMRPEAGAVGAALYSSNGTIQHAGVILGLHGVAGHIHKGQPRGTPGYFGRAGLIQNFSAVTAACMVMRRSVFEEVGGFDEDNLVVEFNDVDLCLRLRKLGYLVVWTPYAELYHVESASRPRNTSKQRARHEREINCMRWRWGAVLMGDPYYNPNLSLESENFALAFPPRAQKPWKIAASAAPEPVLGSGAASGGALKRAYGQRK